MNIKETDSVLAVVSEILFVLLPIIVIVLLRILYDLSGSIFKSYEWSFVPIVLFGQTLVKFASGISRRYVRWQIVSLFFSLLIVIGLIPSVMVLMLLLLEKEHTSLIYIIQMILVVLSILTYSLFGTVSLIFFETPDKNPKMNSKQVRCDPKIQN